MKLFTVIMTMSIIAALTILSEGVNSQLDEDFKEDQVFVIGKCPPIEMAAFEMISYGTITPSVIGCAFLDMKSSNVTLMKSFGVKFGRFNNSDPHFCKSGNGTGMERIVFSCLPPSPSDSVDPKTGSMFTTLHGRVIRPDYKTEIRCAIYSMFRGESMMVISSSKSCIGLKHLLAIPFARYPQGATLLRSNKPKNIQRHMRSVPDEKDTIKNNTYLKLFCDYLPFPYCPQG